MFSYFIPVLRKSHSWNMMIVAFVGIFLCFGYMTGSDWRVYEVYYYDLTWGDLYPGEPGYFIYMLIMKQLGFSFWPFFILTKCVCYVIFVNFLYCFCRDYFLLCFAMFVAAPGLFLFIDNPMRNLIAIAFFLLSVKQMFQGKKAKSVILLIIASTFHVTAFLMFFLYPLFKVRIKSKYLICFIVAFFIIMSPGSTFVQDFLLDNFVEIPYIGNKIVAYFIWLSEENVGAVFSLGFVTKVVFAILLFVFRKEIEQQPHGVFLFNASFLYLILYRLGLSIVIFQRLPLYLSLFYLITSVSIISFVAEKFRSLYRVYLILFFVLIQGYVIITSSFKYVPYSNYLFYLDQDISYGIRENYNHKNSPFKEKD